MDEQTKAMFEDQERLRENLSKTPPNSDLAKRYLKKLDNQESSLETLSEQKKVKKTGLIKLQEQLAKQMQELDL
ncbi:hypothetical protein CCP4SC76_1660002 [Gammaproteobacteria bacterium]